MKSLTNYIQEKLVIKKSKRVEYKYFPQTKKELQDIIEQRIKQEGNEVDLNDIDVSKITDMAFLFKDTNFNGNVSEWDVSNVTNMVGMFYRCSKFNQDISNWDVSNVTNMHSIFWKCKKFNQDLSNWDVSKVKDCINAFYDCTIENKYKPKFNYKPKFKKLK